jgi:uridine nucleosidase
MSFFAGTYAEVFSITEGPPLHDPLAVAAAIYPEIFNDQGGERFQIDIVTEGLHSLTQSEVGELGRTKVTKLPSGAASNLLSRKPMQSVRCLRSLVKTWKKMGFS